MTKANKMRLFLVTGIPVTAAFIAWCGGYNFDERSFLVGYSVFCVLCAVGASIFISWEDIL